MPTRARTRKDKNFLPSQRARGFSSEECIIQRDPDEQSHAHVVISAARDINKQQRRQKLQPQLSRPRKRHRLDSALCVQDTITIRCVDVCGASEQRTSYIIPARHAEIAFYPARGKPQRTRLPRGALRGVVFVDTAAAFVEPFLRSCSQLLGEWGEKCWSDGVANFRAGSIFSLVAFTGYDEKALYGDFGGVLVYKNL